MYAYLYIVIFFNTDESTHTPYTQMYTHTLSHTYAYSHTHTLTDNIIHMDSKILVNFVLFLRPIYNLLDIAIPFQELHNCKMKTLTVTVHNCIFLYAHTYN